MKAFWNAISIVLVLHLLGILAVVGWLRWSDRLNSDRLTRAYEVFELSGDEQQIELEETQRMANENRQKVERTAYLEQVEAGPVTVADRLSTEQRDSELALHRIERLKREVRSLQELLENTKKAMNKEREVLDAERQAFDEEVARTTQLEGDKDFKRAVATVEQLKPAHAKQLLQELLGKGKVEDVVDYLAAMKLRRSAAILKKFEEPAEVAQAMDLIQRLRNRRIDISAKVPTNGSST